MRTRRMRAGIVGCGNIARSHLAAYQAAGVEVTTVYDTFRKAAETLAEIAGPETYVASSIEDMIAHGVDAASVCSPPGVHLESCSELLSGGVAVLCEKPMEKNAERASRIADAVRRSDAPFVMGFCHRFHPPVVALKKLIDEGTLGDPLLFRSIFAGYMDLSADHRSRPVLSGGGTVIDTSSHSVDLFRFLVGEPTDVGCLIGNLAQDLPVEDAGVIILSAGRRALGEIAASHSVPVGTNELVWYGTKGTAILEYWDNLSYQVRGEERVRVDCRAAAGRFEQLVRHFIACVRGQAVPSITVEDGLAVSRIIDAAYASAATGRTMPVDATAGA